MSKVLRGAAPPDAAPPDAERPETTDLASRGPVIPGALYDARREAERIVAEARAEAERLRAEAAARGEAEGRAAAQALLVAAEAARARLLSETEGDIARLAVQIARKVVAGELELGDAAILRIVSQALQRARLGRAVVVRLHPDDAAALAPAYPKLLSAAGRTEGLALRPDPSLARGDCVIDSELGTVDARLDTQLAAIERALAGGDLRSGGA